jgi:hypothetical protein
LVILIAAFAAPGAIALYKLYWGKAARFALKHFQISLHALPDCTDVLHGIATGRAEHWYAWSWLEHPYLSHQATVPACCQASSAAFLQF